MTVLGQLSDGLRAAGFISLAMAFVALLETAIPLHARGHWNGAHLVPNLALMLLTFATNVFFNAALVLTLAWLPAKGLGLLNVLTLGPVAGGAVTVVVLEFAWYVTHRSMHKIPAFWRFHRVHHSDPVVDVTTTIRQHPGEGVIRYVYLGAFATALGASPGAFAVYRVWSALNGLLEHANLRVPARIDSLLSLVVVTPNMHKIHHSRRAQETDTNYGNIFSVFDRLLATFTPSVRGLNIPYGLDGFDDASAQTTAGLLAAPFRDDAQRTATVAAAG